MAKNMVSAALLLLPLIVAAQDSLNVSMISQTELWGQTVDAVAHDGYVYLATSNQGIVMIDATDPDEPRWAGTTDVRPYMSPWLLVVADSLLIVSTEDYWRESGTVEIFRIVEPDSLERIYYFEISPYVADVAVYGTDMWIGSQLHSIANPSAPQFIADFPFSGTPVITGNLAVTVRRRPFEAHIEIWQITGQTAILQDSLNVPGYLRRSTVHDDRVYLGIEDSIIIVDFSIPHDPIVAGSVIVGGYPSEMVVHGNYLYAANTQAGVQVLNVTDVQNPEIVETAETAPYPRELAIEDDRLYVGADRGMLDILDISQPDDPVQRGALYRYEISTERGVFGSLLVGGACSWESGSRLGFVDVSDPTEPEFMRPIKMTVSGLCMDGPLAYVASGSNGLLILDLSNVPEVVEVGSLAGFDASDVAKSGDYAFVVSYTAGQMYVIDVSDPAVPFLAATLDGTESASAITADGDIAAIRSVLRDCIFVDISDPYHPEIAEVFDVGRSMWSLSLDDDLLALGTISFGVQLYGIGDIHNPVHLYGSQISLGSGWNVVLDGNRLIADGHGGIQILDIQDPEQPVETGWYSLPGLYNANPSHSGDYVYANNSRRFAIFDVSQTVDVPEKKPGLIPDSYELSVYPNPFNPTTTIQFDLRQQGDVTLIVYDIQGREVERLISATLPAGRHSIEWSCDGCASGLYLVDLKGDNVRMVKKAMLIR
jgi:hypothetical protein